MRAMLYAFDGTWNDGVGKWSDCNAVSGMFGGVYALGLGDFVRTAGRPVASAPEADRLRDRDAGVDTVERGRG
jgi:hypothetical protein